MYTTGAAFSDYQNELGGTVQLVLELTDGVSTWYFSDRPLQLTDGYVRQVIEPNGIGPIRDGFSIYTREFVPADVTVRLVNHEYKLDNNQDKVWLVDDLKDIRFTEAKIYCFAGNRRTSLSDGFVRFKGKVIDAPAYSDDYISVRIVSEAIVRDRLLPDATIKSVWPNAPRETRTKKIPIVYGKFSQNYADNDWAETGLAVGVKTDKSTTPTVVFSDHVLNAITELLLDIADITTDHPPIMGSATLTADDSGRGTAIPTAFDAEVHFRLEVDHESLAAYNISDPENVKNSVHTSYADIRDNISDVPAADEQIGRAYWLVPAGTSLIALIEDYTGTSTLWYNNLLIPTGHSFGDSNCAIDILMNFGSEQIGLGDARLQASAIAADYWDKTTDRADDTEIDAADLSSPGSPVTIQFDVEDDHASNVQPDGVVDNDDILRVGQLKLHAGFTHPKRYGDAWAMLEGREYGSWITSRSSNYADGDCIEDPAGIIESLLRDELNIVNADLDQVSFIDAENTTVKARINLHSDNEMKALDAIRQLCEQSTFAVVYTAGGVWRLVPLNDASPTTDRTIIYSHLLRAPKVSVLPIRVNHLTVNSRYLQEYGVFYDSDNMINAASATILGGNPAGYRYYDGNWPNVVGDARGHIQHFLVHKHDGTGLDVNGIWAYEHVNIELECMGFSNADLQPGDWIELDDTSVDPHLQCYGASWSGRQFLIYETEQMMESTRIRAMELYA